MGTRPSRVAMIRLLAECAIELRATAPSLSDAQKRKGGMPAARWTVAGTPHWRRASRTARANLQKLLNGRRFDTGQTVWKACLPATHRATPSIERGRKIVHLHKQN